MQSVIQKVHSLERHLLFFSNVLYIICKTLEV